MRAVAALIGALALTGAAPTNKDDPATLIRGARVFDGSGAPAIVEDVLIEGDRIAAVGPGVTLPPGVRIVDAQGLTLIPGLHDLHTHLRSPAFFDVERYPRLVFTALALSAHNGGLLVSE